MSNDTDSHDMRRVMDMVHEAQCEQIKNYCGPCIEFKGPHHGVHIRRWRNPNGTWSEPMISIECDLGYCGIGSGLTAEEARGLGQALVRAAAAI